jgi:hypothetical protein
MIETLTNGTILWLAVIAGVTLYGVVSTVARAFGADEVDDRVEDAIKEATNDLLDALKEANATLDKIAESNAYLEESERDYNQREGYADEAPGTSIHEMFVDEIAPERWQRDMWVRPRQYGRSAEMREWLDALRPRGFRPAETAPPYAGAPDMTFEDDIEPAVDLRKPNA